MKPRYYEQKTRLIEAQLRKEWEHDRSLALHKVAVMTLQVDQHGKVVFRKDYH